MSKAYCYKDYNIMCAYTCGFCACVSVCVCVRVCVVKAEAQLRQRDVKYTSRLDNGHQVIKLTHPVPENMVPDMMSMGDPSSSNARYTSRTF